MVADTGDVPVYDHMPVPTDREVALVAQYHDLLAKDAALQALSELPPAERRPRVHAAVAARLRSDLILKGHEIERLTSFVTDELAGLGPLQPLFDDPAITEIMVNGPRLVFIEREGHLYRTPLAFRDARHVQNIVDWVIGPLGRRLDQSNPRVDGRLPDRSRLHAIIPPIAMNGPYLTIRRFRPSPWTLPDLVQAGALSQPMADYLAAAVRHRLNIVIAGGTGGGKTSLLDALGRCIPARERIVTIEDLAELRLDHPQCLPLEARPPNVEGRGEITLADLVREALRMRPDRLIIGEVRGPEAFAFLQAMNTGHPGSLLTIHANSPEEVPRRLETLVLMAGVPMRPQDIREYLVSIVDVVVFLDRRDGQRRVARLCEVVGTAGSPELRDLFWYDCREHRHRQAAEVPVTWRRMQAAGLVGSWEVSERVG